MLLHLLRLAVYAQQQGVNVEQLIGSRERRGHSSSGGIASHRSSSTGGAAAAAAAAISNGSAAAALQIGICRSGSGVGRSEGSCGGGSFSGGAAALAGAVDVVGLGGIHSFYFERPDDFHEVSHGAHQFTRVTTLEGDLFHRKQLIDGCSWSQNQRPIGCEDCLRPPLSS